MNMRLVLALFMAALGSTLWAADPFLGTWRLDLSRSKFEPGPAPRSLTMTWSETPQGLTVASSGVRANGQATREEYSPVYDGNEHSRPGPWNFDAIINRQISETEREDIFKKDGAVVGRSRLVVSDNGRTLTIRFAYGELRDVRIFERQTK